MAEQYIEMYLKYIDEKKGLEWVHLAQDTVKLGDFLNTVINLLFSKKSGRISRKSEENFIFSNNDCAFVIQHPRGPGPH